MTTECPISHPCQWPVVRLGDIALKIGSGATPTGGEASYLVERTRFALVRSQNVFDRRFERAGLAFISDEQAERLKGVVLEQGDLLLNITGDGITFSRSCAVPNDILPACVNQHVAIIRFDPAVADAGFIVSYLTYPAVKSYIESFNAGGSRRAITKGHIESFQIPLPPRYEQRAIGRILGTLDDKIELNRCMNETLDAMARALFKSWFVDFDPVRAKVEGREPDLLKPLNDFFPARLVDSELGEIPEGWVVGKLEDFLAELVSGARPKGGAVDEGIPSIGAENVIALGKYDFSKEKFIPTNFFEQLKSKGAALRPGDVLLYKDGAQIGRKTYFDGGFPHRECAINEHVFILRTKRLGQQRYMFFGSIRTG